jgi:hypothetical protein
MGRGGGVWVIGVASGAGGPLRRGGTISRARPGQAANEEGRLVLRRVTPQQARSIGQPGGVQPGKPVPSWLESRTPGARSRLAPATMGKPSVRYGNDVARRLRSTANRNARRATQTAAGARRLRTQREQARAEREAQAGG